MDYKKIKKELDNCSRPLFFFHDDADGLCSFLLFYRYKKEGRGIPVKSRPLVDEKFLRHVKNYQPDKIFVLDVAGVTQEFVDQAKTPIVWIDHHPITHKTKGTKYFNPRKKQPNKNIPVTEICYKTLKQDLWIAAVGTTADWKISSLLNKFIKKYPKLLKTKYKNPGKIIFDTELGHLIKIFNFILKGNHKKTMTCVKILTRIDDPYELLEGRTARARYVLKHFKSVDEEYERLLNYAMKQKPKGKILMVLYDYMKTSFAGALSNEILYRKNAEIIMICRKKQNNYVCSLRSKKISMNKAVEKIFCEMEGHGGGHANACGACFKIEELDLFLEKFKSYLGL